MRDRPGRPTVTPSCVPADCAFIMNDRRQTAIELAPGGVRPGNVTHGRPARKTPDCGDRPRSCERPRPQLRMSHTDARPALGDPRRHPDQPLDPPGAGETLLIECFDLDDTHAAPAPGPEGGAPRARCALVETKDTRIVRELVRQRLGGADAGLGRASSAHRMEQVQAYIGLRGARNINEMADVPAREDEPLQHALPEARPLRVPDQADEVVRAPPAQRRAWPSRPG